MINIWNGEPLGYNKEYDTEQNLNKPQLEEFVINDGNKHSCFLIIPGGGYDHLSNHEGANVAKKLNEMGISAFVLYYRTAPYSHPIYLWDSKRAMRYIRYNAEKYNIYSDKIGVMGFSAGGHLACMTAENYDKYEYDFIDEADKVSARPDALCMCYPVVSVFEEISHKRSSENLCGSDTELKKALSGERAVRENMPPVFIWHTFEDKSVDCRNSLEMGAALKAKGQPFEMHIFTEGKHGLDLAEGIDGAGEWFKLFIKWVKRNKFME